MATWQWCDLWTDEAGRMSGTKIRLWIMFIISSIVLLTDHFVAKLHANTALLTIVLGTFVVDRGVSKISNLKYSSNDSNGNIEYNNLGGIDD